MAQSQAPSASEAAAAARPLVWTGWKRWFLLGACFGLGYGITQRLVNIDLGSGWSAPERFSVQPFPGTELNSLRQRVGDTGMQIRGDLDRIELERQQKGESAAIEQRRAEMEEREREQQQADPSPSAPDPVALPPAPAAPADPAPEANTQPAPPPAAPPAVPAAPAAATSTP